MLPLFHKIKGILTPKKGVGHNLEERTGLCERLTTLPFASTFPAKPVNTFSWTSVGSHCVGEIPGRGWLVGGGQEDPQRRGTPGSVAKGRFCRQSWPQWNYLTLVGYVVPLWCKVYRGKMKWFPYLKIPKRNETPSCLKYKNKHSQVQHREVEFGFDNKSEQQSRWFSQLWSGHTVFSLGSLPPRCSLKTAGLPCSACSGRAPWHVTSAASAWGSCPPWYSGAAPCCSQNCTLSKPRKLRSWCCHCFCQKPPDPFTLGSRRPSCRRPPPGSHAVSWWSPRQTRALWAVSGETASPVWPIAQGLAIVGAR